MAESGGTDAAPTWTFDPSWRSFSAVQGGIVVGSLLRSARGTVMDRTGRTAVVRSASAHFLAAVVPGEPVRVEVLPHRLGATSSVRAQAWQGESLRAVAQVLLTGSSADDPTPALPGLDLAPGFVTPDQADPMVQPVDFVPFTQHLEFRSVGPGRPLAGGPEPRLAAWIRLAGTASVAGPLVQLGVVADGLPPSWYATATVPTILPTVEMTLHLVRAVPPVGAWLRVEQWTSWNDAQVCIDDAVLHDEQGLLVARCRQTRRVLSR